MHRMQFVSCMTLNYQKTININDISVHISWHVGTALDGIQILYRLPGIWLSSMVEVVSPRTTAKTISWYILVCLNLIFCRCWKWFVLGLLANQILMPLCLIHTWVYRSIGCSLSQQPFCATGAANVLHVLDVFFTLVFFLELLVRLCPGSKTPEESSVAFCCQIIGIVADLLTHFFHLVKVFPRSFTLNMPESIPQKCLLHIHWMIHCTFLPTVFSPFFSEVDLRNLIFQARIDFWIEFSNEFLLDSLRGRSVAWMLSVKIPRIFNFCEIIWV